MRNFLLEEIGNFLLMFNPSNNSERGYASWLKFMKRKVYIFSGWNSCGIYLIDFERNYFCLESFLSWF